jgi:hypothetical protein
MSKLLSEIVCDNNDNAIDPGAQTERRGVLSPRRMTEINN